VRIRPAVFTAALLAVLAAACANPGYDSSTSHDDLVKAGLTDAQATCVTRAMDRQFRARRLDAHSTPTETEHSKMAAILEQCHVDVTKAGDPSS
jgi:hypothetical protein